MLFNSVEFLLFAAAFFAIRALLPTAPRWRWPFLVGASFFFYGWWDWRFLFLIVASGLLDFTTALLMGRHPRHRRAFLALSILGNVGSLAFFKYAVFLSHALEDALSLAGLELALADGLPEMARILPVGISFYTFQSMSYTIDVYRGELQPTRRILHFFAYLSLFPQLVAGPVVRARHLLPQLAQPHPTTEEMRWDGTRLILRGFFKKVVIADNLAGPVASAFGAVEVSTASGYWWLVVTLFAFQIYGDFSGYSDIARGLGRWMGLDFPRNFNHPYAATSLRDFWARWHISLSTWFRDYVYIPLGGSRTSAARTHGNLWLTFILSGLWHGAGWTFVLWGAFHGAALCLERVVGRLLPASPRPWFLRLAGHLGCLFVVWVGWVLFRAESLEDAITILRAMVTPGGAGLHRPPLSALFFLLLGIGAELAACLPLRRKLPPTAEALLWGFVLAAIIFLRGPGTAFIYFQF